MKAQTHLITFAALALFHSLPFAAHASHGGSPLPSAPDKSKKTASTASTANTASTKKASSPSSEEHEWKEMLATRLSHAKELLGRTYRRTVASFEKEEREYSAFLLKRIHASLPPKFRSQSKKVHRAILAESRKHGFDPAFLIAVIENESSFNPLIRGSAGEIGLMQVLPTTGRWMAEKINLSWNGPKTLEDPVLNIRIGAAYLAQLRGEFDFHGRLYLSAYNMGGRNVRKALEKRIMPKDYAARVIQRYLRLYEDLRGEFDQPDRAVAGG